MAASRRSTRSALNLSSLGLLVRPCILRRFAGFRYMLNPPYTGGTL
jgi:hypothetical protein